ncbi:MAG: PucR family transcriptional regulator ligand-binding domain-containing protein [Clostridioides sp.]|nr:PucR family transcriptional regulator ligand-binding domain-containing protein [Clostridioides sp.]
MKEITTVRDILSNPRFKDFKVIAGKGGLDRAVNSVTVMDAPDPYAWSTGKEIVLCSGYIFRDNPKLLYDSIVQLNEFGMSAFFIKMKRFIKVLPNEVKNLADELNFPIIDVPIEFAHIDVINPILSEIIDKQTKILKQTMEVNDKFSDVVIHDGGIQAILDLLSNFLKSDIMYCDLHFQKRYYSILKGHKKPDLSDIELNTLLETYFSYRIGVNKETYGYIIFLNKKDINIGSYEKGILNYANTSIVLDVQKKLSRSQVRERQESEFVQDIILGNIKSIEEIQKRSDIFGWNILNKSVCVMIADIDDFKKKYLDINDKKEVGKIEENSKKILNSCNEYMKLIVENPISFKFSDSIVFLINLEQFEQKNIHSKLTNIGDNIREIVRKNHKSTVTVGIGSKVNDPMETHMSFEQASLSIKIARTIKKGRDSTIFYEDLGVYEFLYNIYKNKESEDYAVKILKPILVYDKNYKSELMDTLICIISCDWNLKLASSKMYVHYNTIKYRYKKICDLLEYDLNDYESKLNITLATRILKMLD